MIGGADAGAPELVQPLSAHRFDSAALLAYLRANLEDLREPCEILQFQGGQSNPTFALRTPDRHYVLRKQPPGKLLPSAHAVDREFRVMQALRDTGVPVPRVRLLCTDAAIIGQMFYVMDFVQGRIFTDILLPSCPTAERDAMYDDMNRVLAALHRVDPLMVGLGDFGRPQNYVARQIARWSKQYAASKTEDVPAMDRLLEWLPEHAPANEMSSIVHGDFRLPNLVFHPTEPRVVAVLDWELATLGNPLADLAYNMFPWYAPAEATGFSDQERPGIPPAANYAAAYARRMGLADGTVPHLDYYVVFSLFRLAAIVAGVYRRALDGNAADSRAAERGERYRKLADCAWSLAQSTRS